MTLVVYLFLLALGLVVGSFLNVVVYSYNTGHTILGRSRCFSCRKKLAWYELIPVFSFVAQKGRCRACGSHISWQYPAVEILTGIVFVLIGGHYLIPEIYSFFAFWQFIFRACIFSLLIVIAVYDLRHKIIPEKIVYPFIVLALLSHVLLPLKLGANEFFSLLNALLAGGVLFLFFWGLWRYSDGRWMGFGDAKLSLGIGFLLGFPEGLLAVASAFVIGAVVGLILIGFKKISWLWPTGRCITIKSEIPFAPFLVLGTLLGALEIFNAWIL